MSNSQLYLSIGLPILFNFCMFMLTFKYIDAIKKQVDLLVNYMILHEGKIATLEERTKKLG